MLAGQIRQRRHLAIIAFRAAPAAGRVLHDHGGFRTAGGGKSSVIMAGFRLLVIGK
jgi:hypothetical protein